LAIIKVSQRAIALVEVKRPAADGLETEGFLITFAGIERFAILINITQCLDVHYVTVIRQSDSGSGCLQIPGAIYSPKTPHRINRRGLTYRNRQKQAVVFIDNNIIGFCCRPVRIGGRGMLNFPGYLICANLKFVAEIDFSREVILPQSGMGGKDLFPSAFQRFTNHGFADHGIA